MSELKPCPFCHGEVEVYNPMPGYESGYGFYCLKCNAYFQLGDSEEESIEAWNIRYEKTCHINAEMIYTYKGDPIDEVYKCSECNEAVCLQDNYCPNCGSRVING